MPSQTNIETLRSDIRIQALVKKQMGEHEHLIANHHKEMQELRDALKIATEKFKSLSEKGEEELGDLRTYTVREVTKLYEILWTDEKQISEQKKTIEDLNKELLIFHSLYASKIDMDRFKREVTAQITEVVTCNINGFQECQSQLRGMFNSLLEDLTKSKAETEKKFMELIDQIERNYNVLKIDREGVLKEIRVWEKTIFIIEKKIENIYTLIERINKRGET
jgi:hypothetical protein